MVQFYLPRLSQISTSVELDLQTLQKYLSDDYLQFDKFDNFESLTIAQVEQVAYVEHVEQVEQVEQVEEPDVEQAVYSSQRPLSSR